MTDPAPAVFPAEDVYPSEDLYPGETVYAYHFTAPPLNLYYPLLPDLPQAHLLGIDPLSPTVFRIDGVWQSRPMLSPAEEASADRIFRGGYIYVISTDDRNALISAGFGDGITLQEVLP